MAPRLSGWTWPSRDSSRQLNEDANSGGRLVGSGPARGRGRTRTIVSPP
jgi:hypothetical protein